MAEINIQSNPASKAGVKKSKKVSTNVDLTPMVDLGFLLITFFIFATTLTTPNVVKFRVPNYEVIDNNVLEQSAMTALVGPNENNIYYYQGSAPDHKQKGIKLITFAQLRKNIINLKKSLTAQGIPDSLANLIIKPLPGAVYGTFMNVYDEVAINNIQQYIKVKPDSSEIKIINAYNKFNNIKTIALSDID